MPGLTREQRRRKLRVERIGYSRRAQEFLDGCRLLPPLPELMRPTVECRAARVRYYAGQADRHLRAAFQVAVDTDRRCLRCTRKSRPGDGYTRGLCRTCYTAVYKYARRTGTCRSCRRFVSWKQHICRTCFPRGRHPQISQMAQMTLNRKGAEDAKTKGIGIRV